MINRGNWKLGILVATLAVPAIARCETIGAPVINRSTIDSAQGTIFVLNSGFTQSGTLTGFSFFNNDPGNTGLVTPLLLKVVGGNYIIEGVGTTVANAGTGAQSFAFGLTTGSAHVTPGEVFGWKDGSDADATQTGVVLLDFVGSTAAGTQQFFNGNSLNLFSGSNLGSGTELGAGVGQPDRDYSIQATTTPSSVPDVSSTLSLFGLGLAGLYLVSRVSDRRNDPIGLI